DELQDLNEEDEIHPAIREITEYYEFAKLADKGEKVKAGEKAKEYRENYSGQYSKKASHLEKTGERYKRNRQSIGLLCPLTGSEAELGEKIHNSVLMAVKRYNASSDKKIDLVVRDTKGDPVETGHHTRELLTQHHVAGIIGPVMSSTSAVTAAMLTNYPNVLMITPTATDYGIGSYGSNIFQLNVTLESLGASIADYAVKNLNIKEFAVISPESDYGEKLFKSFSEKVEQLGGKILETQVYTSGKNDFKEEFREIRIAAFQENEVDMDMKKQLEALDKESLQTLEDSTAEIGGLFLPVPADDIVKLAPQTFFHKVEAQLLGTNSWHNTKVIMDGKKYVNGAFFSAGFKYKESNSKWKACRSLYETKFGKDPGGGIEIPLSYDAAVLVLKALRKRNPIKYLANIEDYDATAGFITFNKNGINIRSSIYKIADRDFVKIK
ncbi:MAG: penicillin-binding protein activator, partial [Chitinivibrionales bacterium]